MIGKFQWVVILLLISLTSYGQGSSTIFISAQTKGKLQDGFGIKITVTNIKSKKCYESKSLGLLSSHSYIDNLPSGLYIVTKMEIPLGSVTYINRSDELTEYFDTLSIQSGSANYLGDFAGYREVGDSAVFRISIKTNEVPSKLIKKASKKGLITKNVDWIKHYPYKEKELMIF